MFQAMASMVNIALRNLSPAQLIFRTSVVNAILYGAYRFYHADKQLMFKNAHNRLYRWLEKNPLTRSVFAKEIAKDLDPELDKIDQSLHENRTLFFKELPEEGISQEALLGLIEKICDASKYEDRTSGALYKGERFALSEFVAKIHEFAAYTNPLHPDLFENVRQCENEVLKWCADLLNAEENDPIMGCINTGGTDSIFESVWTHKKWALQEKGFDDGDRLNVVIPSTAHVAFRKAAEKYGLACKLVDVDPVTGKVDINKMRAAIDKKTIMIAGSAPNYPHGVIDDIEALSKIALEAKCGLHVDACLGGFLIVFMERLGFKLPLFDFRLKGVTAVSMDTHKYGFVPKGSSVCAMRKRVGQYQADFQTRWSGGLYATPSSAGSRSGSNLIQTWAVMAHIGLKGYLQATKDIINTSNALKDELSSRKHISVLYEPEVSVIAFKMRNPNDNLTYLLLSQLEEKGWHLNGLQDPAAMHFCITLKQAESRDFVQKFIKDLDEAVEYVLKHPSEKPRGAGAQYGALKKIPAAVAPQVANKLGREYNFLDSRVEASRPNAVSALKKK